MRQTKKEAIPKEVSLVGLRNIHMTFQTAFRQPCCKKTGRLDVCFGSEWGLYSEMQLKQMDCTLDKQYYKKKRKLKQLLLLRIVTFAVEK